jgi:preprotein translocase subunit SecE
VTSGVRPITFSVRHDRHGHEALELAGQSPYLPPNRSQGTTMATRTNPLQFIQQVRSEVSKVVWPTRREVLLTTAMVFVMATLTAIFFFFVDWAIRSGLQLILTMTG